VNLRDTDNICRKTQNIARTSLVKTGGELKRHRQHLSQDTEHSANLTSKDWG